MRTSLTSDSQRLNPYFLALRKVTGREGNSVLASGYIRFAWGLLLVLGRFGAKYTLFGIRERTLGDSVTCWRALLDYTQLSRLDGGREHKDEVGACRGRNLSATTKAGVLSLIDFQTSAEVCANAEAGKCFQARQFPGRSTGIRNSAICWPRRGVLENEPGRILSQEENTQFLHVGLLGGQAPKGRRSFADPEGSAACSLVA